MDSLDGVWRLVDSRAWNESSDRLAPLPYGTDPIGQLVFSRGRMLISLWSWDADPGPQRPSVLSSYGGRYTFDGSTLECDVAVASDPRLISGSQVRAVVMLAGDEMLLRPPARCQGTQLERRELVWQRVWSGASVNGCPP
jgi:hypothetical protein